MPDYFPNVSQVSFEGPASDNPLAFKHYNAEELVAGKPMKDHLRFAASYWHCMKGSGADPFGVGCRSMPWLEASDPMSAAHQTMDAMFEFTAKLTIPFWCFHDRDIAPELDDLAESNKALDKLVDQAETLQKQTGIELLWGTACLFIHPRFMAGAGTSPSADVFAHAGAQIKKAIECTQRLGGHGYVFWGGREGYDTLLNTDLGRELDHMASLLQMALDFKKEIGFEGQFYIEPKPKEPTTHQYDYDAQSCHAFLLKYGLEKDFKLNIEANHATLAGHSFHHELAYAAANSLLGSIDANRGDMLIGWDTDQFPTNLYDTTFAMLTVLRAGGLTTGGLNFDAKLRRQSTEPIDLVYAHIGGMDAFARGLKIAAKIIEDGRIDQLVAERYTGWDSPIGKSIESGQATLADLEKHALRTNVATAPAGRQELLENIINEYL
ncbi:xylose isomerase [Mucisphaera sp.]|uniref:xylose isomerase n=1 Tax=Mucisphaera sp. TaxID=2913024 RepID=UPI003D13BE52